VRDLVGQVVEVPLEHFGIALEDLWGSGWHNKLSFRQL
jgi:hypothetical protein